MEQKEQRIRERDKRMSERMAEKLEKMEACRGTAHRARIILINLILFMLVIAVFISMGIGIARNNYIAYNMKKQSNIKAEEEIIEAKTYSVYMLLNELDTTGTSLAGNKIKITDTSSSDSLNITVFNAVSDEQITADSEGNIEVPEDGIKLKLEIKENNIGNIEIANVTTIEEYTNTFKKANIEINATDGKLESYVKDIVKDTKEGEITHTGSEENTAMFMYEEEENGIIKIKENEYVTTYYVIAGINGLTEEEIEALEETDWSTYNRDTGIEVEKNGIIYTKSKYHDREFSDIKEIHITNIDKINPIATVKGQVLNDTEDEITVTLGLKDGEATDEYGKSGLFGYAVTATIDRPDEFIACEDDTENEERIVEVNGITENGTYYVWVIDKAKNVAHIEFQVTDIPEHEAKTVAIILDAPVEELEGTEYNSLEELVTALESHGLTKDSEPVKVQIVSDVRNDSTVITNQNIILDLNGYTIASKLQEPVLSINNANVKVMDIRYAIAEYITDETTAQALTAKYATKEDGIGRIENKKYIGVKIGEGGNFTIGDSGEIYAIVDIEKPIIEGKSKGIYNNGGSFNFYGGQIIAEVPIEGELTDTPILYDSTADIYEDGRIVAKLGKLAEIEAMIGLERYIKIEDAIKDANERFGTSEEEIEIDVTADITRLETIEVPEGKNIILDLNGYKIINSLSEYVLTNSGKLSIKDSSGARGEIKSTVNSVICNNETGDLTVEGGKITTVNAISVGIVNLSGASVIVNGGEIVGGNSSNSSSGKWGAGIRNDGNGEITVNGGTLKGYNGIWNKGEGTVNVNQVNIISNCYGICNEVTGIVKVSGGEITGSSNGIYNKGAGRTEITGGTITGGSYGIRNYSTGEVIIENAIIKATADLRMCNH